MDIFTPGKRSQIMKRIPSKNSKPEVTLRKALFALGLRYRLHSNKLPGKPDIVFGSKKVAVFVDGDWWHGRHYEKEHKKYTSFWQQKIKKNMLRDQIVNNELKKMGWTVFRVWQKDMMKDPAKYAQVIYDYIKSRN